MKKLIIRSSFPKDTSKSVISVLICFKVESVRTMIRSSSMSVLTRTRVSCPPDWVSVAFSSPFSFLLQSCSRHCANSLHFRLSCCWSATGCEPRDPLRGSDTLSNCHSTGKRTEASQLPQAGEVALVRLAWEVTFSLVKKSEIDPL